MTALEVVVSIVLPVIAIIIAIVGIVLAVKANGKADRSLEYTEKADARAQEKNHVALGVAVDFDDGQLTLTNSGTGDALGITGTITTAGNDREGAHSIEGKDLKAGMSLVIDAPEAHEALIKLQGEQLRKQRAEQRRRDAQSSPDVLERIRARSSAVAPEFYSFPVEFHVWWDLSWSTPAGNTARDKDGHDRFPLPGE
ncbi:hypothetical protein [Kocuria palustris]|uniref:hypothetical protein n=1 Tax=Kocuria palustris TaxID=71999 RepID=UPI0011A224EF|nr:hypothetical protein [Kocuria palustris]